MAQASPRTTSTYIILSSVTEVWRKQRWLWTRILRGVWNGRWAIFSMCREEMGPGPVKAKSKTVPEGEMLQMSPVWNLYYSNCPNIAGYISWARNGTEHIASNTHIWKKNSKSLELRPHSRKRASVSTRSSNPQLFSVHSTTYAAGCRFWRDWMPA